MKKLMVFISFLLTLSLISCGGGSSGGSTPVTQIFEPIELISSDSNGIVANSSAQGAAISGDGRYVAFSSGATNLTLNVFPNPDVFLRDTKTNNTIRLSTSISILRPSGASKTTVHAISTDGSLVVFESTSNTLVSNDTNGLSDIFLRNTILNTTELISRTSNTESNGESFEAAINKNGNNVVFSSTATNLTNQAIKGYSNIFVSIYSNLLKKRDISLVSVNTKGEYANNNSYSPAISLSGRFIVFYSDATNLVANDTNSKPDIFIHDLKLKTTSRVSVASDSSQANSGSYDPVINENGRYIAFRSAATNLVKFDNNGYEDIFVHDTTNGITTRVSVTPDGSATNGASDDKPAISADGRYIAFYSDASNLVVDDNNGYADIFVYDQTSKTTKRVSIAEDGTEANSDSSAPDISDDGNYIVFRSNATNLVQAANNGMAQIFRVTNK